MDDLLIKVIVEILNDFTPISLVAVILGNLFTELIKGWRGRQQQSRPVRETLAFLAVMAMMKVKERDELQKKVREGIQKEKRM